MSNVNTAAKWMEQGIAEHARGRQAWSETKLRVLNAGVAFTKAKSEIGDGNFSEFLLTYEHKLSRTSVYRYIGFLQDALEWTAEEHPELKSKPGELLKAAYKVVLQSPKSFIALMRQLGEMRKFGEYDAVKYATRKLSSGAQIEFHFDDVFGSVDLLQHLGDDNYQINYPEGKDPNEALAELETGLETALTRVRTIKQHGRVIEA